MIVYFGTVGLRTGAICIEGFLKVIRLKLISSKITKTVLPPFLNKLYEYPANDCLQITDNNRNT